MSERGSVPSPKVVSEGEWQSQRNGLLEQEKALTRQMDRVNAARRRLPMVKLDKTYTFEGPGGKATLLDLFEGRRQLVIYHFMFDPAWEKGCPGCTGFVNELGDLSMLGERNTSFALISRAPLAKLDGYKKLKGWDWPWYSSFGNDFNRDFGATTDKGEAHGLSVFFRVDDDIFHTYSAYRRGTESLTDSYALLDRTPYGRQEDFEESPPGWPQKPTYG
jgi:predicted dithiol-disulfide oxidoreductase (DUF899 family)